MSIRAICTNTNCLQLSEFARSLAGQTVNCMHCSHEIVVPRGLRIDGLVLDEHAIIRQIGKGAMGRVFEGVQLGGKRRAAIKILNSDLARDRVMNGRFEREARIALELKHPHIVAGYAAGQAAGQTYIAMEFMDGENALERLKRKGRLSPADAIAITASVANALAHAKERGIVHRDVKPANILTNSQGMVKLADLGLVREDDSQTMLTLSNAGMGTPLYMSPEQSEDAKNADHRSDIYSLGVTFLFLLTGKHPFKRQNLLQVIKAHREEPLPDSSELGVELPPVINSIAQKMAAKDPDERFQDYECLCASLHHAHEQL